jgi:para-nitrobenzyl esterase
MAMPAAKGLFHRAVVQSGPSLREVDRDQAMETAEAILAYLGIEPSEVDRLQDLSSDELLLAMKAVTANDEAVKPRRRFHPVVDGRALPRHPFDPTAPATSADMPMMIGTTNTESTFYYMADPTTYTMDEALLRAKIGAIFAIDAGAADRLIATYRKMQPTGTPTDLFYAMTTDKLMRWDTIAQAERKVALEKAPTYMYLFTWETKVDGGKGRSGHGMEITFALDNLDKAAERTGSGPSLQALADKMSAAWVAFARTGNPNVPSLPHWPAYTLKERATMIFNDQCTVVNDPQKEGRLAQAMLPKA